MLQIHDSYITYITYDLKSNVYHKSQTCFSGNKCSLSTLAATGFSSPSAKSLHVLYNNRWVSDKDDNDAIDLFVTPFKANFTPIQCNNAHIRIHQYSKIINYII